MGRESVEHMFEGAALDLQEELDRADEDVAPAQRHLIAVIRRANRSAWDARPASQPPWMIRQVRYRDRGCRFPGCGTNAFTQAHHIEW